MTRVLLADGLVVATERKSDTAPEWMAVEFSQPVCMIGADIVSISGAVLAVVRDVELPESCELSVEGSNDLIHWDTIVVSTLPGTPQPFAYPDIAVGHEFVRLRYMIRMTQEIEPPIDTGSGALPSWTLTVVLETGLRAT